MNPAGAGPLKSPRELSEELGDCCGTFCELGSGSLGRLARGVQRQRDGCQIWWPLQLGLAAYGHQRNRPHGFGHGKTLRRDRQSAVKEHHNGPFPLKFLGPLRISPPHLPFPSSCRCCTIVFFEPSGGVDDIGDARGTLIGLGNLDDLVISEEPRGRMFIVATVTRPSGGPVPDYPKRQRGQGGRFACCICTEPVRSESCFSPFSHRSPAGK
jgi:hypothetical protein